MSEIKDLPIVRSNDIEFICKTSNKDYIKVDWADNLVFIDPFGTTYPWKSKIPYCTICSDFHAEQSKFICETKNCKIAGREICSAKTGYMYRSMEMLDECPYVDQVVIGVTCKECGSLVKRI